MWTLCYKLVGLKVELITDAIFRTFEKEWVGLVGKAEWPEEGPSGEALEPTNQGEVPKLSHVIQIDEGKIQERLGEVVRSTVEEALNAVLDAE